MSLNNIEKYILIKGDDKMHEVEKYIRSIPDFPEPGIIFRDITTVMQDPEGFKIAIDEMIDKLEDLDFDLIVGLEARGFAFGTPIAYALRKGFVPVRKKGKLPCDTISEKYDLEYGSAEIEIHVDAIKPGQKVVIADDLIATGGTVKAAIDLIERLGGEVVGCVFLMELAGLEGRKKLDGYRVDSVVTYEGK
jgi:adenine phosphoribosyltransferase